MDDPVSVLRVDMPVSALRVPREPKPHLHLRRGIWFCDTFAHGGYASVSRHRELAPLMAFAYWQRARREYPRG